MLKILWKRREIAPEVQFLLLSTIFSYLMLDFYVKTRIRFSLRTQLFKITKVKIMRINCTWNAFYHMIIIVSIGTDRSEQTVLQCLSFHLHLLDAAQHYKAKVFKFLDNYVRFLEFLWNFTCHEYPSIETDVSEQTV